MRFVVSLFLLVLLVPPPAGASSSQDAQPGGRSQRDQGPTRESSCPAIGPGLPGADCWTGLEEWLVVGVRREGAAPAFLQEVDRSLAAELQGREGARAIGRGETAARLGVPSETLAGIDERISEGELYFFQLETAEAKAHLERSLAALAFHAGEGAWERARTVRLLLALIHLRAGDGQSALDVLMPLAGVQPSLELDESEAPADLVELWRHARERSSALSEGWLRVECEGTCDGARVHLEGFGIGRPGQAIPIPPGRYRLLIGDEAQGRFSLSREAVVRPGEETKIVVNLSIEEAFHAAGWPSIVIREGAGEEEALAYLSSKLGSVWLLGLGQGEGGEVVGWSARDGAILGSVRRSSGQQDGPSAAIRELIEGAVSSKSGRAGEDPRPLSPPPPLLAERVDASFRVGPTARWAGIALTATMAGIAGWLTWDASSARAELRGLEGGDRSYSSLGKARRAEELAGSIQGKETWSAILWTGAALGAVGSAFLFLQGDGASASSDAH